MDDSRPFPKRFQPRLHDLESRRLPATMLPIDGSLVVAWNEVALEAIRAAGTAPPQAARDLAILQVSVLSAVRAAEHLAVGTPAARSALIAGAVDAAAHRALTPLFPGSVAAFDSEFRARVGTVTPGPALARGIALGEVQAARELDRRAHDGAAATAPFTPGTDPGQWRPTPPAFAAALLPNWPGVKPFGITHPESILNRIPGLPPLTSRAYADALEQVRSLGAAVSTTRASDQTEIARFWADGTGTETPPGHWNTIAGQLATARHLGLNRTARLFATLDAALADAGIACWSCKYDHSLWRPITAIQLAEQDNNPATTADPTWTPLLTTPPFPSYVSGHSTFSAAAATVLNAYFGDSTPFTTTSDGLPATARRFSSFDQAAREAGMSRIYGGIHFAFDNSDGLTLGHAVGRAVLNRAATGGLG